MLYSTLNTFDTAVLFLNTCIHQWAQEFLNKLPLARAENHTDQCMVSFTIDIKESLL